MDEKNILNKKIKLLKILSEGYKIHPAYRAHREATGRCKECIVVWNARLELNGQEESKIEK